MNENERLLEAFDGVEDKYLNVAAPKGKDVRLNKIIALAASFIIIIGLSLLIFNPFKSGGPDNPIVGIPPNGENGGDIPVDDGTTGYPFDKFEGDYSNLIAAVEKYKSQEGTDNSFDVDDGFVNEGDMPENGSGVGSGTTNTEGGNGNLVENTDNQVAGIVEGDLMKMTDKYIFRIGYEKNASAANRVWYLRVYSVDKDKSRLVTNYKLPIFYNEVSRYYNADLEMYLSGDANTITLIRTYVFKNDQDYVSTGVGVVSLDISNVNNIKEKSRFSIDGQYISSRMIGGRLLLFASQSYHKSMIDTQNPATFIPSVNIDDEKCFVKPADICIPDEIYNLQYTTMLMVKEEDLSVVGAKSLLGYNHDIYVSENNVFLTREYSKRYDLDEDIWMRESFSDISIIGYSANGFTDRGIVTVTGVAKNQYSFDEKDGYLRVVTTTSVREGKGKYWWEFSEKLNASLFVIDILNNSIVASVENFAPEGEEVASVRFEGNNLYVCTAIIRLFSDPVFFFDLSDYSNITYTDTGYIKGFSSSLIDLGEGYLLGIGNEDILTKKIEVYKKEEDAIISIDKYCFKGNFSNVYKSYLIDREKNLFGLMVQGVYDQEIGKYENLYLLFELTDEKLCISKVIPMEGAYAFSVRAATVDGYLSITSDISFVVEKIG